MWFGIKENVFCVWFTSKCRFHPACRSHSVDISKKCWNFYVEPRDIHIKFPLLTANENWAECIQLTPTTKKNYAWFKALLRHTKDSWCIFIHCARVVMLVVVTAYRVFFCMNNELKLFPHSLAWKMTHSSAAIANAIDLIWAQRMHFIDWTEKMSWNYSARISIQQKCSKYVAVRVDFD